MSKSKAELIFEKWKAELASKDRTMPRVAENFDELFNSLHRAKIQFDEAYAILDRATKAHYPPAHVAKTTFRAMKKAPGFSKTESEFVDEWKEKIATHAKQMFYSFYDIDGTPTNTEEKSYGNMSVQEYRKQRKYIESHPLLDWTKIKLEPVDEDTKEFDSLIDNLDNTDDDDKDDVSVDLGDL